MTRLEPNPQQKRATESLEGRLLISAGAGSGKTSVLTRRAVNAVTPDAVAGWTPVAVDRLLVITFTEKAAGELAERVRGALRAAGRQEDARRLDAAWISTIHGMCARMLRQSALEVGLDPAFGVLGTVDSRRLQAQAFEQASERLLESAERARALFAEYSFEGIARVVAALADEARTRGVELGVVSVAGDTDEAVTLCEVLLRLTSAYAAEYQLLKRDSGQLDFDDLQVQALDLLQNPELSGPWTERFELTMVDEFQDTDALQLDIVERLAGQRLCSVGDEQQSIYGFRGADVDVYRLHRQRMIEAGADSVVLSQNYRSHRSILDFVNQLFGSESMFGQDLVRLEAGAKNAGLIPEDGSPRVEVLIAEKGSSGRGPRKRLADQIAERLDALIAATDIEPQDVAVLLRTYTHAEEYAEALRARGIDTVVTGGDRFFGQPETAALTSLLKVLVNPRDEEALVLLMTSAMWEFTDDALLALRREVVGERAAGLWQALAQVDLAGADGMKARALQALVGRSQARLGRIGLRETILRAVEESGFDLRLLAGDNAGGQAYANVLKFARLASDFEAAGGAGVAAFITHLNDKEKYRDHETPAALVSDGSNAVTIMSMHASKGLEFPVVVLAELGSAGHADSRIAQWDLSDSMRLALRPAESGGSAFVELVTRRAEKEKAGERRLFYVACTRARELLILSGAASLKSRGGETMLGDLVREMDLELEPGSSADIARGSAEMRLRVLALEDVGEQEMISESPVDEAAEVKWLEMALLNPVSPEPAQRRPNRLSYSAIKAYQACPRRFMHEMSFGELPRAHREAETFGSAVHAALELAGESGTLEPGRAESLAAYYRLSSEQTRRLKVAVEAYARSAVAQRVMVAQGPVVREAPFAIRVGEDEAGFLLEGTLDIHVTDSAAALVVDFKTGVAELDAAEMKRRYELQARCYALAALKAGSERVEVVFVRLEQPDGAAPTEAAFTFEEADSDELEHDLLGVYARLVGPEHPAGQYDEYACGGCSLPAGQCEHAEKRS